MYFWCFGFRGELGFLNYDDVCMCVVNKQFELLEFVSESVYVDLQNDEISLTIIFTSTYYTKSCTKTDKSESYLLLLTIQRAVLK